MELQALVCALVELDSSLNSKTVLTKTEITVSKEESTKSHQTKSRILATLTLCSNLSMDQPRVMPPPLLPLDPLTNTMRRAVITAMAKMTKTKRLSLLPLKETTAKTMIAKKVHSPITILPTRLSTTTMMVVGIMLIQSSTKGTIRDMPLLPISMFRKAKLGTHTMSVTIMDKVARCILTLIPRITMSCHLNSSKSPMLKSTMAAKQTQTIDLRCQPATTTTESIALTRKT